MVVLRKGMECVKSKTVLTLEENNQNIIILVLKVPSFAWNYITVLENFLLTEVLSP